MSFSGTPAENDYDPGLTPEEQVELEIAKKSIMAKRSNRDVRVCRICKRYAPGTGICGQCEAEIAHCPLCGDKTSKTVCMACVNAGAPWCRYCRRVREGGAEACPECLEAIKTGADKYHAPVYGGGASNSEMKREYDGPIGSEMPERPIPV